jgi:hypothetical protein
VPVRTRSYCPCRRHGATVVLSHCRDSGWHFFSAARPRSLAPAAAASGGTDSESQAAVPAITIELRAQLIDLLDRGWRRAPPAGSSSRPPGMQRRSRWCSRAGKPDAGGGSRPGSWRICYRRDDCRGLKAIRVTRPACVVEPLPHIDTLLDALARGGQATLPSSTWPVANMIMIISGECWLRTGGKRVSGHSSAAGPVRVDCIWFSGLFLLADACYESGTVIA